MASNVGSTATITGNPQNMIIGSVSQIPYGHFAAALSPIAVAGLILTIVLIALMYPREFLRGPPLEKPPQRPLRYHGPLVVKSMLVAVAMMALFFAGLPVAEVAIVGGAVLLFTRRVKAEKVYFEIDWPLLLMFVGLFVVVAGLEYVVLTPEATAWIGRLHLQSAPVLAGITAMLSNVVSNVPAVLVLRPFVVTLQDPQRAWLVVAMASTLAGNLTLVGSVANLIVAQRAKRHGVVIGFWAYFRVGLPLTVLTILFGLWVAPIAVLRRRRITVVNAVTGRERRANRLGKTFCGCAYPPGFAVADPAVACETISATGESGSPALIRARR